MQPDTVPADAPRASMGNILYNLFSPHGDFVGQPFHLEFTPFALSQSVTGVVPILLFALHGPENLRMAALMFLAFKVSIGAVLSAAIISRYFPVLLNEEALRARNFWGMARVVPFEEIARVDPIRWLIFTPFARISTHRYKNWIWLPLFLVDQKEFEAKFCAAAPKDNPLSQYFKTNPRPNNSGGS